MRVWRISNYLDLSGQGGRLAAGRWNRLGTPVVYATDHPSTALLETLVHLNVERVPLTYRLLAIDVPDDASTHKIGPDDLPDDWRTDVNATQALGTRLLNDGEHLAVLVPTVMVPHAWNVLLNPRHRDIDRCSIAQVLDGRFDLRLIR